MSNTGGLGGQAAAVAIASAVSQAVIAVTYLAAARGAGPSVFGLVVTGIAIGIVTAGVIDFGTNSFWVRELSSGGVSVPTVVSRILSKCGVAIVAGLVLLVVLRSANSESLWVAGPVCIATVINQASVVFLRANRRGKSLAATILIDRLSVTLCFGGLTLLALNPTDALWIALTVGPLVGAIVATLMSKADWRELPRAQLLSPWTGAKSFGVSGLAVSAQALDLPLLASVGGAHAAGVYGSVNRWTQPMTLLAASFSVTAAPFIARARTIRSAWVEVRTALWMPAIAFAAAIAASVFAEPIVSTLLGSEYESAAPVLRILSLASALSVVSQPLAVAMQSLGREKLVARVLTIAVVVQLIGVLVLGGVLGATAASAMALSAQFIIVLALGIPTIMMWRRSP